MSPLERVRFIVRAKCAFLSVDCTPSANSYVVIGLRRVVLVPFVSYRPRYNSLKFKGQKKSCIRSYEFLTVAVGNLVRGLTEFIEKKEKRLLETSTKHVLLGVSSVDVYKGGVKDIPPGPARRSGVSGGTPSYGVHSTYAGYAALLHPYFTLSDLESRRYPSRTS